MTPFASGMDADAELAIKLSPRITDVGFKTSNTYYPLVILR